MFQIRTYRRAAPAVVALLSVLGFIVLAQMPVGAQAPAKASGKTAAAAPAAPAVVADAQFRVKAFDQVVSMKATSPFRDLKWQFIGPTNISGRVVDVAVANRKGKTRVIYVASASGGLWKTENEGTTFEPIFEQGPSVQGGDVTVAPSDPNIIWFGTGEANIFRSSNAGVGIYKSTDAGKTWQHMGLAPTHTIPRIVVHPTNPEIVYVAAGGHEWTDNEERGVYKTIDGGKTWDKILFVNARTAANDLVMDPTDPNTLYATTWQRIRKKWNDPRNEAGYTGSGIHKTTDGGKTWTPINEGLPGAEFRGRIGIDVARSNPNVVYAFVDNYEIARQAKPGEMDSYGRPRQGTIKGAEIYRSDNKGQTWKKVSESNAYMEGSAATYGWVFSQVRVDPNNENVVYFMGLQINQSTDGGKTWKVLRGMHTDHHAMWIDPANSDNIINGNDGGIVMSYDFGKTWRQFTTNLPVVTFFNVAYDMAEPFHVYGSVQDHGSYRAIVDLSKGRDKIPVQVFEDALGGEGTTHAIDTSDNNTVYASSFYGNLDRADLTKPGTARGWRPSSFLTTNIMPKAGEGEVLRGQWMAPTLVSPHDPNVVYHGLQYVYRSMHKGDAWERISPDLTGNVPSMLGDIPYQTLYALAESPKRFGLLYAGTDDGRLHITRDGGKVWTELTANLPQKKWISRVVPSAFDEGTVYVTQNGKRDDEFAAYIYKSTDFGKTFKNIAGNIPCGPVNVIREDPANPKILYVGTDMAVFVTTDGGATWNVLGANLPSTYVQDIVIHPRDRVVVVATHGRGLWVLDAVPVQARK
ncbi:MAG TPA: hypothetical protein VGK32_18210 [Vicinamibacterales bacterium]|jgi:hypothetical protein